VEIPNCFTPVRINGGDKALGLVVRRRINAPKEILNGERPRMDDNRPMTGILRRLDLVVHSRSSHQAYPT
jgi:hypothetical protein